MVQTWKLKNLRAVQDAQTQSSNQIKQFQFCNQYEMPSTSPLTPRSRRAHQPDINPRMLGHTAIAKKSSKFEDSDGRMPRHSRAVSELPQRPSPRPKAAAASEASGGAHRRAVGVRGTTAPRSPLHEKRPAGAGAGSRVPELEAKLERAHGQIAEMREQLTAAEKARKDARAALVEAKKRFAAKKRDAAAGAAAPAVKDDDDEHAKVPAMAAEDAVVAEGANKENGCVISPATDAVQAVVPGEAVDNEGRIVEEAKKTSEEEVAEATANGDGEKRSQEGDELRAKLMAKDMEVYELRAKLMVRDTELEELRGTLLAKDTELGELRGTLVAKDTELGELRGTLVAKDTELGELRAKLSLNDTEVDKLTENLMAKDAEIAALEVDNADLTKTAEDATEAARAAAARTRETEHALRESAAREARLAELLRASERAREALEAEAQRSRVQSEQWRKAAEEAAVVLVGGANRDAGASGGAGASTDKGRHTSAGARERTVAKDADEEELNGKRKGGTAGGAMRVLSDLWKKKAHK
ncbi:hypothetical protein ACP70R_040467 [Stipagrostis hirtigluma subsp. patula]